jgi:hypothetical protein
MSRETIYTCDHCGKTVEREELHTFIVTVYSGLGADLTEGETDLCSECRPIFYKATEKILRLQSAYPF